MSLKRMAMKMALAFAAQRGYSALRNRGGMSGLTSLLRGGGGSGGGLSSILGGLTGGSSAGGLGGLTGGATSGGGGLGGLLGGLAAMAGGSAALAGSQDDQHRMIDDGPADEGTAALMVRAIGQAVRADGQIDAAERATLDGILGDADTPAERAAIDAALSEPVDPEALAAETPAPTAPQVYAAALTAIDPDHPAERAFLDRFASALGLDESTRADLHAAAGK